MLELVQGQSWAEVSGYWCVFDQTLEQVHVSTGAISYVTTGAGKGFGTGVGSGDGLGISTDVRNNVGTGVGTYIQVLGCVLA